MQTQVESSSVYQYLTIVCFLGLQSLLFIYIHIQYVHIMCVHDQAALTTLCNNSSSGDLQYAYYL